MAVRVESVDRYWLVDFNLQYQLRSFAYFDIGE